MDHVQGFHVIAVQGSVLFDNDYFNDNGFYVLILGKDDLNYNIISGDLIFGNNFLNIRDVIKEKILTKV